MFFRRLVLLLAGLPGDILGDLMCDESGGVYALGCFKVSNVRVLCNATKIVKRLLQAFGDEMKKIIYLFLIFLASIASVFIVQLLVSKLWNLAGVSWGPGNLPVDPIQQVAMLSSTFIAGLFAPIVAITIYRAIPWVVVYAICAFGMSIDLFAALVPLATLPLWFKVAFVVSVPLQVVVGTLIGLRVIAPKSVGAEHSV